MKHKKLATTAIAAVTGMVISSAQAGESHAQSYKQQPRMVIIEEEPCFADNEWTLDVFTAYQGRDGEGYFDNGWGGGVGINYFFARYFGLGVEGFWNEASSENNALHHVNALAYIRFPIDEICLAPYVLGGGGVIANSENNSDAFVGGGIEWRMKDSVSVFGDGRYSWTDENDIAVARMGLRFAF